LRGQRIHLLRPGRARDHFHTHGGKPAGRHFAQQFLLGKWIEKADMQDARTKPRQLLAQAWTHAEHGIGQTKQLGPVLYHASSGGRIGLVAKPGRAACTRLDRDGRTEFDQLRDRGRRGRHPAFTGVRFVRETKRHGDLAR
jgi:hypothetical protein